MSQRPNILFLMSDEHRPDVTGYEGNPVVRTPVLDELARTGVVFRNAYTPSPICIPARQSMTCGQLPRTCGVERYGQDLPPFSMTFPRRLSQYAYQTICIGKLHHMGPDQMQGWTQRAAGDMHVARPYIDGRNDASFDMIAPLESGCGKWSDAKECQRAGIINERSEQHKMQAALRFIDGKYVASKYDRPNPHQPVLLKLSYNRPHYPYFTTADKFDYYLNRVEPFIESETFDHPFLSRRQVKPGDDASVRDIRRTTAAYYGMIEEIDEDFGTVLERLRFVGQSLDDWWIIYTSDHGEMLGQHGIWEKQKFFEASARVPLIIRPPLVLRRQWNITPGSMWDGRAGKVVEENVNLCDLFATLCQASDAPLPPVEQTVNGAGLDSRSLVPLMAGQTRDWHERYHDETVSQFGGTNLMIKRGALKYQRYDRDDCTDQPEVLFDLAAEPDEGRNLINEAKYADAVATFRQRCAALGFGPDADPDYRNAGYASA